MAHFLHSFVVKNNIESVWSFYTDVSHLEVITPKDMALKVLQTQNNPLRQDTEIWVSARLVTISKWHSKITLLRKYEYVDEMLEGRFKVWKHHHKFNKIHDNETEVIDEIDFEIPYGILGKMLERFVLSQLRKIFDYRQQATISELKSKI